MNYAAANLTRNFSVGLRNWFREGFVLHVGVTTVPNGGRSVLNLQYQRASTCIHTLLLL
jgi:hypothetical protein